jgi:hypothetical protein
MEEWNYSAAICYWQYILAFLLSTGFLWFLFKKKKQKKKHTHTHIAVCHWYDKE